MNPNMPQPMQFGMILGIAFLLTHSLEGISFAEGRTLGFDLRLKHDRIESTSTSVNLFPHLYLLSESIAFPSTSRINAQDRSPNAGQACDNINTASATDLQRVNRIGTVKAQAIIDYRNQHGPFTALDELTRVSGIGPATLSNFRSAGFCVLGSTNEEQTTVRSTPSSSDESNTLNPECNNINSARATDLQRVNRIGAVKAQAIIDYRNQNGPFKSLNDLTNVRGIGPATLDNFRQAGFCTHESNNLGESPDQPIESLSIQSQTSPQNCTNVNTANAIDLQRVNRIGAVKAQAIIDYRNQNGPFKSLNDLTNVRGIGPATLDNFRQAGFCTHESNNLGESPDQPIESLSIQSQTSPQNCTNVNTANAIDLQRVNRIGAVKAQAIIDYRNQNGPFKSLNDLTNVRGIGPATLDNFRQAGFCAQESHHEGETSDQPTQMSSIQSPSPDEGCTNVNTATAIDLQRVNRIGPVRSQAIIDHRSQNGPFKSLGDLTQIRGIGHATLENFRIAGFCVQESTHYRERANLPASDTPTQDQASTNSSCLDINTADADELQRVKGIGSVKAQTILDFRNSRGAFRSLNSLLEVRGIGPATIRNFQEAGFCVDSQTSQTSSGESQSDRASTLLMSSALPYDRSLYGYWWDEDGDCQNTRDEVLIANSQTEVDLDDRGCVVLGGEWLDVYMDSVVTDPREIDIDHFVPLSEVHRSGGAKWDYADRTSYSNDLSVNGTLIPVSASANRSKGDRDPAHWLPTNEAYHCQYVDRWVHLKNLWKLTMDYDEHQAVQQIQAKCAHSTDIL